MKNQKQQLLIDQTDQKLAVFKPLQSVVVPTKGWIHTLRVALKMSMRQLGNRLSISAQSVKEMEGRECTGAITLKSLHEVARVLDMKLVYGFVPKQESLEAMIEKRAHEIAREIVLRTHQSMQLEAQQNTELRIQKAIQQKTQAIKEQMPKFLWD
ncbi:mobile mystery protein A [Flavobacterium sp. TSSA_36]|uniref:mobile mystery protein A n=1 Tax=Flavobacterium sp. TSSA_36 TaxID=3447669 RepID=UPI003F4005BC